MITDINDLQCSVNVVYSIVYGENPMFSITYSVYVNLNGLHCIVIVEDELHRVTY